MMPLRGIFAAVLLVLILDQTSAVLVANSQRPALNAVKAVWGSVTNLSSWNIHKPCSEWVSITCDTEGRVKAMVFTDAFQGSPTTIPNAVGLLLFMETLILSSNFEQLAGPIPASITSLFRLAHLDLSSNSLTGAIPSKLGALTRLTYADLSVNRLSGTIPDSLQSLVRLTFLELSENAFDAAPLRATILAVSKLPMLTHLGLLNANLTGPIPAEISSLKKLQYLELTGNPLSGGITDAFGSLSQLTYLSLYRCGLTGIIPANLGSLAKLQQLSLGLNALDGSIPTSFASLTEIISLEALGNNLTGVIPPTLGASQPNLQVLDFSSNSLHGTIPVAIGKLDLLTLVLRNNQLTGEIPAGLGTNASNHRLNTFNLANNSLTGPIPAGMAELPHIAEFIVSGNALSGPLPLVWATDNFDPNYDNLVVTDNYFSGSTELQFPNGGYLPQYPLCPPLAGNCLTYPKNHTCAVEPQKTAAVCNAFCGALDPRGICGGHGTCLLKAGKNGAQTPYCACDSGYRLGGRHGFTCVKRGN